MIDICKEAMEQYLIDNPRFVDRGDNAVADFAGPFFVPDNDWHDLDLSSIIPATAVGVLFRVEVRGGVAGQAIKFRKKGNASELNVSLIYTSAAGLNASWPCIEPVGTDGMLEYEMQAAAWPFIDLSVKGWWL